MMMLMVVTGVMVMVAVLSQLTSKTAVTAVKYALCHVQTPSEASMKPMSEHLQP